MEMTYEFSQKLTVKKSYDIIVAGGGVAGVAAAVSAARNGRSVLLLEKSNILGGLGTLGLVNLFVPMCNGRGVPVIRGMAEFREPSRICGVIFNDCSEMYYRTYGPVIEEASGIPVLGYLPHMEEAVFESRHLGLMTAEEIRDLEERIQEGLKEGRRLNWEEGPQTGPNMSQAR